MHHGRPVFPLAANDGAYGEASAQGAHGQTAGHPASVVGCVGDAAMIRFVALPAALRLASRLADQLQGPRSNRGTVRERADLPGAADCQEPGAALAAMPAAIERSLADAEDRRVSGMLARSSTFRNLLETNAPAPPLQKVALHRCWPGDGEGPPDSSGQVRGRSSFSQGLSSCPGGATRKEDGTAPRPAA